MVLINMISHSGWKLSCILFFYHSSKCDTICEGYGSDGVYLWRKYVFGIGLSSCLFCLCVVVVGIGDRVKLMDNKNKKLVIGKLKTQSIYLFFIISFMCFNFWIVMMVVATLKARMPWFTFIYLSMNFLDFYCTRDSMIG